MTNVPDDHAVTKSTLVFLARRRTTMTSFHLLLSFLMSLLVADCLRAAAFVPPSSSLGTAFRTYLDRTGQGFQKGSRSSRRRSSQRIPILGRRPGLYDHAADEVSTLSDAEAAEAAASTNVNANVLNTTAVATTNTTRQRFDLTTALFCSGLAFDAYLEPPSNSSRWEKGSSGMNVAFLSPAFTRSIYKGLVEVTPIRVTGLPEDQNALERVVTGAGVDAVLIVAALEGSWQDDVRLLENEQYHEGVLDLTGAAHMGRSTTAWANINEIQSKVAKKQRGRASPYHIPASWGTGGQAVWPEAEPFYLYVQDPANARLVFTVLDNDRMSSGTPIGSTHKKLGELIPQAQLKPEQVLSEYKRELLEQIQREGDIGMLNDTSKIKLGAKSWQGELKLTSKPRKKDKKGQILAGAAAGATLAGPMGAAAGAVLGSFYEGQVQGRIQVRLRYLPIPPMPVERTKYTVHGGMPGISWGRLLELYTEKHSKTIATSMVEDLEHCFFVNHDTTGASCAVYRSLKEKLIVVSFRGTCVPIDLLTDVSIVQDAWIEGQDVDNSNPKVHAGFRNSLNSISRRLKELVLATPAPGDEISTYDLLVTGHSLGGALATLFVADIAGYGIDAGRSLPQLEPSEPWWKSIANTFMGQEAAAKVSVPPRPKSLRLYSFGSPRVGNRAFAELFDTLLAEGSIEQAYRIVNGEDVVARLPRTVNAILGSIEYEHCGPTVLLQPAENETSTTAPLLWIEGESDDKECPVRDGMAMINPMAEGSLLSQLFNATQLEDDLEATTVEETNATLFSRLSTAASQVQQRLKTLTATDVASLVGIDRKYTERELRMVQSILEGRALAHHMEDEYYAAMGGASGFLARVGQDIIELVE